MPFLIPSRLFVETNIDGPEMAMSPGQTNRSRLAPSMRTEVPSVCMLVTNWGEILTA